jgi:hypothetical protein
MALKKKRRLTKEEIEEIRRWMDSAPMGRKPTVRTIAKRYGVNQPSVVKSLGGWKGVHRGRPQPDTKDRVIEQNISSPVNIIPGEVKVKGLDERR